MITLHIHLQPQYKYELFHINLYRYKLLSTQALLVNEVS